MTLMTASMPDSRYATALRMLNERYPDPVYGDGRVFVIGAGTYRVSEALRLLDGLEFDATDVRSALIRQTRKRRALDVPVFACTLAILSGDPDAADEHIEASLGLMATRSLREAGTQEGRAAVPYGVLDHDAALDAMTALDIALGTDRRRAAYLYASYDYYVEVDDPDAVMPHPRASWEAYLIDYVDDRRATGFLTGLRATGCTSRAGSGSPQDALLEAGIRYLCGELTLSEAETLAPAVARLPEVRHGLDDAYLDGLI